MQEPNVTAKVPHPDESDIKNCSSRDYSCETTKELNNVPMSICFLVREQAKSQVAIQDIQKRLSHVENVQAEVVDTIIQLRSYFCEATNSEVDLSTNYLNNTKSSVTSSTPLKFSTSTYHSTIEPPRSILKTSYPSKVNQNEFQRTSSIVTIQDQPIKHLNKDSALESDKQDSGLDSDCRDHDGQSSVKTVPTWTNPESNDQLLQLLDEISYRSEYLQKQLSVVEDSTILPDVNEGMIAAAHSNLQHELQSVTNSELETTFKTLEGVSTSGDKGKSLKFCPDVNQEVVQPPKPVRNANDSAFQGFFERKSFCDRRPSSKKAMGKNIDSALVSTILKETNAVDLQRQVLIYLVDNAVLNTKLQELEQALACKNIESEKVENSLKEEARLLMMENRELRITLDEQRLEKNVLRSRVAMLERVLQSMNVENQELNWQLGESLNLQQFSKKSFNNISSSFASNSPSVTKPIRKSTSLPSQNCRGSSPSCNNAKFLSNTSRFFNAALQSSPEDCESDQIPRNKCRIGPIQSSTPFQRPKSALVESPSTGLPTSFYSVKKCLKTGQSFDSEGASFKSAKSNRFSVNCNIPEGYTINNECLNATGSSPEMLTLPMGNVSKFPFNTILEKLKANSEYRLSRSSPSAKDSEASASASDLELELADSEVKSQARESSKSPQVNGKNSIQTRKNRNIHQRIQNILDRIVAESEEAS